MEATATAAPPPPVRRPVVSGARVTTAPCPAEQTAPPAAAGPVGGATLGGASVVVASPRGFSMMGSASVAAFTAVAPAGCSCSLVGAGLPVLARVAVVLPSG